MPFQPVLYANPGAILAGAKGEWDVALMGVSEERAAVVDFSPPYAEIEQTYLVRAGVPIAAVSDVDRTGIRVGVLEKGGADVFLSATLKNATLIRVKTAPELFALTESGKAEVVAASTAGLLAASQKQQGSRVLGGRILAEPLAMAVPKGRSAAAAAYVGRFVESAKAEGLVKAAIDRAALRGVTVAPPR